MAQTMHLTGEDLVLGTEPAQMSNGQRTTALGVVMMGWQHWNDGACDGLEGAIQIEVSNRAQSRCSQWLPYALFAGLA